MSKHDDASVERIPESVIFCKPDIYTMSESYCGDAPKNDRFAFKNEITSPRQLPFVTNYECNLGYDECPMLSLCNGALMNLLFK